MKGGYMKKIMVMLICLLAVFAAVSCYNHDLVSQKNASYGEYKTSAGDARVPGTEFGWMD
jgi:hypothetical protein